MLTDKDIITAYLGRDERRALVREMIEQWGARQVLELLEWNCAAKANGYAYKAEDATDLAEIDNYRCYERSYSKASAIIGNALDKVKEVLG